MRVMIIAGEPSGDLHGAGVVRELKRLNPDCSIYGIGGDKMQAGGMELIYHIREISVMGFWEVLKHLPLLRSVKATMSALLLMRRPDVVVLIDYPGFNLRFAEIAKNAGIRVVYYISPQVWAWHRGRVKKMKNVVDTMLVVFPFEVEIYRRAGIDVKFVGHPLLEVLTEPQSKQDFCTRYGLDSRKPILGLFPGSRHQEIERIFPAMLGAARLLHRQHEVQVLVGVASILDYEYMNSFLRDDFPVQLVQNATYDIMNNSDVAIVTSGTATLETAYYQTPMVVVYKTSWLSYLIGRLLVKIKNISLANIVAGKRVVPELLQSRVTPRQIAVETVTLLDDNELHSKIAQELSVIKKHLGTKGASARVAEVILSRN